MSDVSQDEKNVLAFIAKLKANWYKRFDSDQSEMAWQDTMIEELKNYSQPVLEEAARYLLRNRRQEHFPKLAQCVEACDGAKRFLEYKHPELIPESEINRAAKDKEREGRFFNLAEELIRTQPMAKQAAREGWILGLYWHLVRKGKMPDQREVNDMKASAREHMEVVYPGIVRGVLCYKDHQAGLNRTLMLMDERREKYRRMALGETQ